MDNQLYAEIITAAVLTASVIIASWADVPVIGFVKSKLGLSGQNARVLALVISAIMAVVVLLANGQITPELLSDPTAIGGVIVAVIGMTQYIYKSGVPKQEA